jgi:hypothetical protein
LIEYVRAELLRFRDPDTGKPVVDSVVVTGGGQAPDLLAGYADGYRASWQTALGEAPEALIEDNTDEWRGDHCVDPKHVPGVLLATRALGMNDPRLEDITATILEEFRVGRAPGMRGRNIYVPTNSKAE